MISSSGSHSIRALIELARLEEGAYLGAAAVARTIDAPENYLGKLMQTLTRAGLLESKKGMGGGFRLARDSSEITVHDVVDPVEPLDRWSKCFLGLPECSREVACPVHNDWGRLRDEYIDLLRRTTIAQLLGGERTLPAKGIE